MNRTYHFNYIEQRLTELSVSIKRRGKLNILDMNIHAEVFYRDFLGLIFGSQYKNLNETESNNESIDLINEEDKIIIQVSATCTRQKIEKSLEKESLILYKNRGFTFKFLSLSDNADKLRDISDYKNPHGINFIPENDIIDINFLLNKILNFQIDNQKNMFDFIIKELGSDRDNIIKIDTNLSTIINILANVDFGKIKVCKINFNSFDIDRKIELNDLHNYKEKIYSHTLYHEKIDDMYSEYDKQGVNKSSSVLNKLNNLYLEESKENIKGSEIFLRILQKTLELIQASKNYTEIPFEELEFITELLLVHAFIKCKIFKNPNDYNYATTG